MGRFEYTTGQLGLPSTLLDVWNEKNPLILFLVSISVNLETHYYLTHSRLQT